MLIRLVTVCLFLLTATGTYAETPQEGAAEILTLLKARNYAELFPARYSEWHKTETEGVPLEEAVKRLSRIFEKNHDMMVGVYEQLTKAEFTTGENEHAQISETGETATAEVTIGEKTVPFTLYKMKNGKWGFHL